MSVSIRHPDERREVYGAIGLLPHDEFRGGPPIGAVRARLDVRLDDGSWRELQIQPVITKAGVITYPTLGRRGDVLRPPAVQRFRVRVEADFYVPAYQSRFAGVEFDVYPYNDTNPPRGPAGETYPRSPTMLVLRPAPGYPFPPQVRLVHGIVISGPNQTAVPNVEVIKDANEEIAISGADGRFVLPIRWAADGETIAIDAIDLINNRFGQNTVTLPSTAVLPIDIN